MRTMSVRMVKTAATLLGKMRSHKRSMGSARTATKTPVTM